MMKSHDAEISITGGVDEMVRAFFFILFIFIFIMLSLFLGTRSFVQR